MEKEKPAFPDTLSKMTEQRVRDHKQLSEDWTLIYKHIDPMVADPEIRKALRRINTEIFMMPIEDAIFIMVVSSERLALTSIFGDLHKQFQNFVGGGKNESNAGNSQDKRPQDR
ncbi:MAG: hypothetical protein MUP55_03320 [Candidatus Aenigmarchaeota archaeon]|nr:hypothetical protein [Candidatus Aenigmarchaeota archaeon]